MLPDEIAEAPNKLTNYILQVDIKEDNKHKATVFHIVQEGARSARQIKMIVNASLDVLKKTAPQSPLQARSQRTT